jgi:phosphopantetheine adenylyltransferase
VDHAAAQSASVLLRGIPRYFRLRIRIADGLMNRRLRPEIETFS